MWPPDCRSVEDVPADLVIAIDQANSILIWHENLIKEEIPPRWMWHLDWELEVWWMEIERARKNSKEVDTREEYDYVKNELFE